MKTQKKQRLRRLLTKWGIQDTVKPLEQAPRQITVIKEVLKEVVPQEKLGKIFDSLNKIADLINSSKSLTLQQLKDLSSELNKTQKDADSIAKDLQTTKDGLFKKEDIDFTELETRINEEIKTLRADLVRIGSKVGINRGGAPNQRIQVEGATMSNRYADFNLKGSGVTITKTDNDVTKQVDITLAVSTGAQNFVSGETPSGVTDGVNTVFTLAHTPNNFILLVDYNGQQVYNNGDFTIVGPTITTTSFIPEVGTKIRVSYTY